MNKIEINNFIEMCDNDIEKAKREIPLYSQHTYIDLKAHLEGRSVHSQKWISILFPFIVSALAILGVIGSGPSIEQGIINNKNSKSFDSCNSTRGECSTGIVKL